jgi:hypothetical protein
MAKHTVFISYRREGGFELAKNIKESLEKRGFKVFLDIEDLRKGPFPDHIYKNIETSSDLIAILTPGSLDRCQNEEDWVRKEIAHAIKNGKNIVPVLHRYFQWPDNLPPDIEPLRYYQGLSSDQEYFEASMDKLAELLTGVGFFRAKRIKRILLSAVILIAALFIIPFPWPGDDEICDQYLCIDIPEKSVGTLFSENPYDLKMNIKNRTSTEMFVSSVMVKKFNKEAAKRMGLSSELIHVGEFHGPIMIEPHEKETISIVGNEILPVRAEINILHSLSDKASEFEMVLPNEIQKMPAPRILPKEAIYTGTDGVFAIHKALSDAKTWSPDAHIIAAFPAESKELLEPESRLKILDISSWVVTIFSPEQGKYYTAIVKDDSILEKKVYLGKNDPSPDDRHPTPIPLLGNQKTLALVNANRLICGNWKSLRLSNVPVGSQWSLAWFLPYRGSDSLPIIVDAVSGDLLSMDVKTGSFRRDFKLENK